MILIELFGTPTPWAAHKGYGKKAYNPRSEQIEKYRWQIRAQFNQNNPISGAVRVNYCYHVMVPKGTSKVRKIQMLNGVMYPIKRPDLDNYDKLLSDCFNGIVWDDDSQVVEKISRKIYGDVEKTIVTIEPLCH